MDCRLKASPATVSLAKLRVLVPVVLPVMVSGASAVPPPPPSKLSSPPVPPVRLTVLRDPRRESDRPLPSTASIWLSR